MSSFKYVRLYADAEGVSHFEDIEVPLSATNANSTSLLSELVEVSGMRFRKSLPDYGTEWHPAARRQFVINLSGSLEMTAGDGEVRLFGPGSIVLVEDTTGQGHMSRAIGDEERFNLFVVAPK